jgi:hypothetical protein
MDFFGGRGHWVLNSMLLSWENRQILAKHVLYNLSHTSSPFFCGYFGGWGPVNYAWGCLQNSIFPISVSHLARITCVSLWLLV